MGYVCPSLFRHVPPGRDSIRPHRSNGRTMYKYQTYPCHPRNPRFSSPLLCVFPSLCLCVYSLPFPIRNRKVRSTFSTSSTISTYASSKTPTKPPTFHFFHFPAKDAPCADPNPDRSKICGKSFLTALPPTDKFAACSARA